MFHFLRLILKPLCSSYLSSSFLLLPISPSSLLPSFSHLSLLHPSPFFPVLPFALDLLCPPALLFMVGHQCSHPLKLSSPLSSLHQDELVLGSHAVSITLTLSLLCKVPYILHYCILSLTAALSLLKLFASLQ